jgi:hypothetical protein
MFIDLKTRNVGFYDVAMKLKAVGIENWGFALSLLDETLEGVDPYDGSLTRNDASAIPQ